MYHSIHTDVTRLLEQYKIYYPSADVDAFTNDYLALTCHFIIANVYDSTYIKKLVSENFISHLIHVNNIVKRNIPETIYNKHIALYVNLLIDFFSTYSHTTSIICQNCMHAITLLQDSCSVCGKPQNNDIFLETKTKENYQLSYVFKNKKHNPNKHCEMWLIQLQGKEAVNISMAQLSLIYDLAEEKYNLNNGNIVFNCTCIRKMLKQLNLTKYNSNIPWIRKCIERHLNIASVDYTFTDHEINNILYYFNIIHLEYTRIIKNINILKMIKKKKVHNNLYYPYYLVKIFHFVITDTNKLNYILSNIHTQSSTTLCKNDLLWEIICTNLGSKLPQKS